MRVDTVEAWEVGYPPRTDEKTAERVAPDTSDTPSTLAP